VRITRRQAARFSLAGLAALALSGAPALAQEPPARVSEEALADNGPLPEKAIGPPDAPVTVIEYASMTCGHCANFHAGTFKALKERYVDTGKVRFVFREFPLDPLAAATFMLARCAPEDRYFDVVDMFFETQAQWTRTDDPVGELFKLARQAGFSQDEFQACLTNQQLLDGINAVKDRGAEAFGVTSTPTFFINGERLRGDRPIEDFAEKIDPLVGG
jgi:protein-disulfide isomerase